MNAIALITKNQTALKKMGKDLDIQIPDSTDKQIELVMTLNDMLADTVISAPLGSFNSTEPGPSKAQINYINQMKIIALKKNRMDLVTKDTNTVGEASRLIQELISAGCQPPKRMY